MGSYYPRNSHYKLCSECHEREGDRHALATPWVNARVVHLLLVQRATATVEDSQTAENSGPSEYDEVFITKNVETIDVFISCVIPMKTGEGLPRGKN